MPRLDHMPVGKHRSLGYQKAGTNELDFIDSAVAIHTEVDSPCRIQRGRVGLARLSETGLAPRTRVDERIGAIDEADAWTVVLDYLGSDGQGAAQIRILFA